MTHSFAVCGCFRSRGGRCRPSAWRRTGCRRRARAPADRRPAEMQRQIPDRGFDLRVCPLRSACHHVVDDLRPPFVCMTMRNDDLDTMTACTAHSLDDLTTVARRQRRLRGSRSSDRQEETSGDGKVRRVSHRLSPPQMESFSVPVMKVFISCEATIGSFGLRSSSICTQPV